MPEVVGSMAAQVGRARFLLCGAVQGVGFRPFVYRTAKELNLVGHVENTGDGVLVEVEGSPGALRAFAHAMEERAPRHADVRSIERQDLAPHGCTSFKIKDSSAASKPSAIVLADLATCAACLAETFDPANRRYLYPFTNCTDCGPRFSILHAPPYDRMRTTMADFPMCADCANEYHNPDDRRFHAEPIACPSCGPQVTLWTKDGHEIANGHNAMEQAISLIQSGNILAAKGLGGFHLFADARNADAVEELRRRKARPTKPFALMVATVEAARQLCFVSSEEEALLTSRAAPIVLMRRLLNANIAMSVAPAQRDLGIILPYTPLHHIMMRELATPLIATSGNVSDEPIVTRENEAVRHLCKIADAFLVHDRGIARPVEDSVTRVILERPQVIRCARGYAPVELELNGCVSQDGPSVLGLGGHFKSTTTLLRGTRASVSPHIGDLGTLEAERVYLNAIQGAESQHGATADIAACDLHPDYASTRIGERLGRPLVRVQHHVAHVVSVMAEHHLEGPVLGIAWDGTGLGPDGMIWGGEFIGIQDANWTRFGHIRPFRLPGAEAAIREPRRAGLGVLHELLGPELTRRTDLAPVAAFSDSERKVMLQMLESGLRAPWTTSGGRLFDAFATLLGLPTIVGHEGEAAMQLEALAENGAGQPYPFAVLASKTDTRILDWLPMLTAVLDDRESGISVGEIARRIHETFAVMMAAIAEMSGYDTVVLSGGCFQNRLLTERAAALIEATGSTVFIARMVPPNDGGLSVGQALWAHRTSSVE